MKRGRNIEPGQLKGNSVVKNTSNVTTSIDRQYYIKKSYMSLWNTGFVSPIKAQVA